MLRKTMTFSVSFIQVNALRDYYALPSPNPKQGIKLSSSKGANVFPIIEIAFSYGLGVSPIACKLRLLNEILP